MDAEEQERHETESPQLDVGRLREILSRYTLLQSDLADLDAVLDACQNGRALLVEVRAGDHQAIFQVRADADVMEALQALRRYLQAKVDAIMDAVGPQRVNLDWLDEVTG